MKEIQRREGGTWPTAAYIQEQLFAGTDYKHPSRTNERVEDMGPAEFLQRLFVIENDEIGENYAYMALRGTTDIDLLQNPLIALKQKAFDLLQDKERQLDAQARRLHMAEEY
jgi:hypothetical protein